MYKVTKFLTDFINEASKVSKYFNFTLRVHFSQTIHAEVSIKSTDTSDF